MITSGRRKDGKVIAGAQLELILLGVTAEQEPVQVKREKARRDLDAWVNAEYGTRWAGTEKYGTWK